MQAEYADFIPQVLIAFQYIEEAIRQYLGRCEIIIADRLYSITKYRIDDRGMDKLSLGRLVDKFEKVNGNDDLIKEIRAIIVERNFVAHRSYIDLVSKEEPSKDVQRVKSQYERAVKTKERAEKCFFDLLNEIEILEDNFKKIQQNIAKHNHQTDKGDHY
jgi:hypothetical protein